jgi:superfamily II DNA/RNA helicase
VSAGGRPGRENHVTKTFRDLGVDRALCDALEAQGIVHPFPIQELTLPLALDGNDLIGQARTGTGKTLAFGLPLLQQLDPSQAETQALVVVPTRELCVQVHSDLAIGAARGLTTVSVYGGTPYETQIEALTSGVHVVVGTPGRLLDHLDRGNLDLSNVKVLVLDEADEMLDMGFLPDVERLIQATPAEGRHTMLFSATMPTAIVKMARRYLTHPTFTRADAEEHETAPNVAQHFFSVHRMDKPRVLARILQSPERGGVYVFVRTKHMADRLVNELDDLGVAAIPIHGDLRQTAREKNLDRFREGKATVLVATEVAARGLDVTGVTHVVNYDCPDDEKMYLHRIGRTARAGEAGVAVTFAEFNEVDRLNVIRKAVGATDAEIVPVFSTSDLLTERFDLPEDKPWDHLTRAKKGGDDRRGGRGDRSRGGRDGGRGGRDARGDDREAQARDDRGGRETRRGRDDERRAGAEGGRKGRSDGRPKSSRRSEGARSDRDASRDRATSRENDTSRDEDTTREKDRPREQERSRDRSRGTTERRPRAGADDEGARTRTRTRTRTRSGGDEGGEERRGGRGTDERPREEQRSSPQRTRARGGRDRRASDDQATRDTEGERGGRAGGGRDRGDRGDRDRGGAQGDDRRGREQRERGERGDRSGGKRSRGGRSGNRSRDRDAGGRNGGRQGGDRDSGRSSGRGRRDEGDTPERTEPRGRAARGEGDPQLARRVKVEHLP